MKKTKEVLDYLVAYIIFCYFLTVSCFFTSLSFANDRSDFPDKVEKCRSLRCEVEHLSTHEMVKRGNPGKVRDKSLYTEEMPNGGRIECVFSKDRRQAVAKYYKLLATAKSKKFNVKVSIPGGKIKTVDILDGKEVENPLQKALNNGDCKIFGDYSKFSTTIEKQIGRLSSADIKQQIEMLSSPAPVERGLALVFLGGLGVRAASVVPALIGLLSDNTNLLKEEGPLDGLWPEYCGGNLKKAEWPPTVNNVAAWALTKIGKPAVEFLIVALNNEDWHVQRYAVEILGNIGDTRAVKPLTAALKDKNWFVQEDAIRALQKITGQNLMKCQRGKPAIEPLINAIRDKGENLRIRSEATKALGKIKDTCAVEPLIAFLENQDMFFTLREDIVEALGEIKDSRAIRPLISALNGLFTKDEAAEALRKITGMNFGKDKAKWQWWWKQNRQHKRV